ncbi:protein disulfide-isomerase A4, putative (macronuclear) [Tetrahymena thermophila SB210]|uniref:Protein disulfide-isomerase A4, putative n=1 Tax=Tetrahymena thermophila (strain SB210) TaxID=312017 RepID=Q23YS5_TETTS|nr:protein disulfide-isomerase A4, putative [Tetrahymena thermophila SB210]EAS01730.2 protein disulfide-isomerase A4, putative [Tetrahymena thermophila SB210]|eukprot:XP_001021975.2 protein disulfide-isomerase A4, putative [Tetrahymena thermophila SB210]
MENLSQEKIKKDDMENFIIQVFRGDLPVLVESEEIPLENQEPIKKLVGKNFEQEVYKSKKDVIVYFKSDFIKESESLIQNLLKLDKFIKQQSMEDFIQIFQIDMTKNKIYNESGQILEDIEILPKLYIFIADEHKQNGIKLNGKDFNYLKNVITKISSYDWSNKAKKTQQESEEIRLNIQKFINPNNVKSFDKQFDL